MVENGSQFSTTDFTRSKLSAKTAFIHKETTERDYTSDSHHQKYSLPIIHVITFVVRVIVRDFPIMLNNLESWQKVESIILLTLDIEASHILTSINLWLALATVVMPRTPYIYFAAFQAFCDRVGDSCVACPSSWKSSSAFLGAVRH